LTSILTRAMPRAFAALLGLAALCSSFPAAAQFWVTGTCSSCHGAPPDIAPTGVSAAGSSILGLSESWMASAADLQTRVNAAGVAQGVPAMQNLSLGNASTVHAYFLQVRDAVTSTPAPSFSPTLVSSTSTDSFTFTISNYRSEALTYSLGMSGGNSGDFAVQSHTLTGTGCTTAGTIPAAASTSPQTCTVNLTIAFTPGATGTRSTTLGVNLASPSNPQPQDKNIGLSGQGTAPGFNLSTGTLNFTTKVGSSVNNSVTVSNPGSANLTLGALSFNPAQYSRVSGCNVGTVLAPGGNCVLTIAFAPSAAGATNGSVTIAHNAAGSPGSVTLNGTGTVPTFNASANLLAFGNAQLGVPKALPPITITNSGDAELVFATDPTSAGARTGPAAADYAIASTCSTAVPLQPGLSCTITGTFTPSALGARDATLTIASDATNGAIVVTLSGTGVALPEPVVTFPNQDFPDTVIGENAAQTRQVTIRNDRTRDVGYSVADTADFKVSAESCPTQVVPGGGATCTVTWQFSPVLAGGEGRRSAGITFTFTGTLGDVAPSDASGSLAGQALLPVNLSASTLNPAAVVGTPSTVSLLVTNRSAAGVTLSSLAFSGAQAAEYTVDGSSGCVNGTLLAAGANCSLVIRFDPATAVPPSRNATLTLTHSALGSPQTVTLAGTATPAPQGRIELSTLALSFPDTQLNGSSVQSVTVRNTGNLALNFSAFTLGGAAAADYTRSGSCSTATPLAIGASCRVTLTFAPSALGARNAALTITSDASNGPATLTLSGTGVPIPVPLVSLVPAALDFGAQTLGGIYPARTVRLGNSGTADLAVAGVAITGATFTTASSCPATLAPGAGCDIEIVFTPVAADTSYSGTLRITSNAAGSPHSAALTGRGSAAALPVLVWQPAATRLDFGDVSAGTVSAAQSATILNQGPGGVTFTVLNAVGADAAVFSVGGGSCRVGEVLLEGQSCSVEVRFAPDRAGARSATVQVASTGSFPPTLSLTGTGLGGPGPGLALSVDTLSFGPVRVGAQSLPSDLTLSSTGAGSVRVTAYAVDGPFVVQSKTCPALPFTLPADGECTLTVMFVPQAEGAGSGTLTVTTDATPAQREVALDGSGAKAPDLSSGGCSIASGDTLADPTLWALVVLALVALIHRRRARRA